MLLSNGTTPDQFIPIALEVLSSPNIDHATLKDLHVRCGDGLRLRNKGFPLPSLEKAYAPSKRMRIGYLSGDFRHHVAALFIRGIVNHHDPGAFEIFLYNAAPIGVHDRMTGGFFRVAEHFVQCHDMDVGELSQRIAEDGIHILVDLSGYTAHTRMQVLSLKPAPVQISYIGYPGTYGLKEVDYILSTPDLTGTDHASAFVETPLELPGLYANRETVRRTGFPEKWPHYFWFAHQSIQDQPRDRRPLGAGHAGNSTEPNLPEPSRLCL
jgi:predicted O-linked N-acetylglucosamine transferase (SPINDLY family)